MTKFIVFQIINKQKFIFSFEFKSTVPLNYANYKYIFCPSLYQIELLKLTSTLTFSKELIITVYVKSKHINFYNFKKVKSLIIDKN